MARVNVARAFWPSDLMLARDLLLSLVAILHSLLSDSLLSERFFVTSGTCGWSLRNCTPALVGRSE